MQSRIGSPRHVDDGLAGLSSASGRFVDISSASTGAAFERPPRGVLVGPDGSLYVSGGFTAAGGRTAYGVARWDGYTWSALDDTEQTVSGMVFGPDGFLYAGVNLLYQGQAYAFHVSRWDGNTWTQIGAGFDNGVGALAFGPDGTLYAAGVFRNVGGVPARFIAQWNGTAWRGLGPGFDAPVYALAVGPDGSLYAGGGFTNGPYPPFNHVARWDGTAWNRLGQGPANGVSGTVSELEFGADGMLYAAGNFTVAGGSVVNRVARWDGDAWSALGSGINDVVYGLAVGPDGSVYVGGGFSGAGDQRAIHIARWDGSEWGPLAEGLTDGYPYKLAIGPDGTLYAVGDFSVAGTVAATFVAAWSGEAWTSLGSSFDDMVLAVAEDPAGVVYAGGRFKTAGGAVANLVARLEEGEWRGFGEGLQGGLYASVNDIQVDTNGDVYVVGNFYASGDDDVRHVARWNGTVWQNVGNISITNTNVYCIVVNKPNNIYIGGSFSLAGSRGIAKWNGATWGPVGGGLREGVGDLVIGRDDMLYAAGYFSFGDPNPPYQWLSHIARWDGTGWYALDSGTNGVIHALAVGLDGSIYAGGTFTTAGGVSVGNVARWDGVSWHPLGPGLNGTVYSLSVASDGSLYAGGAFRRFASFQASNIARWTGAEWEPVGSGVSGSVNGSVPGAVYEVLALESSDVVVGGDFLRAGDVVSPFIALYSTSPVGADSPPPDLPSQALEVAPNPTSGAATVWATGAGQATITVYDALGRRVAVAFDGVLAGRTRVALPASLAPGVYVVRLAIRDAVQTARLVVTR